MKSLHLFSLFVATLTSALFAQEVSGLQTTFTSANKVDVRVDRLLALYVPAGQAPTPFLPAGAFTVKWEGSLQSPIRGSFKFKADTSGQFKLSINGQPLIEGASGIKTIQLNKGSNRIVAELASANASDTFVRLSWASKDFPFEPLPPTILSHQTSSDLEKSAQRREGRKLFALMNCTACHTSSEVVPAKGSGMPELGQNAPLLVDIGGKFKADFLADWIFDPHAIRPHTLMPKLLTGTNAAQQAADLAAMLTQGATAKSGTVDLKLAPQGGELFANLGCIACHQRPNAESKDTHDRIPMGHIADKWHPMALVEYLQDPSKHYPSSRMPHFQLEEEEATQLAAYLLANSRIIKRNMIKGDATRGAAILVSAGCLHCHAGMPSTTQPELAQVIRATDKGCLSADTSARIRAPNYELTPAQRTAIQSFLATDLKSLKQDTPAEFAERQIQNLNCTACHSRDGQSSTWTKVESEAKSLRDALPAKEHVEGDPIADAPIPELTWTGEKLQHDWMAHFIAGKVETKPRPWLIARMPSFAHYAEGLALGLNHQHGLPQKETPELAVDAEKIAAGEKLLGADGGFNCISCHAVGEKEATAVFEAPAINFSESAKRLRKSYYHRWVLAPTRIDPNTKMPKYADPEGVTQLTDPYEGNGPEQFEAIWQYIRTAR